MIMKYGTLSIIVFIFLVVAPLSLAADPPPLPAIAGIKTKSGIIMVWNEPESHFLLKIKGKKVRPVNQENYIIMDVDGILLQFLSVAINDFHDTNTSRPGSDKRILKRYEDYESGFLGKQLGTSIKTHSQRFYSIAKKKWYLWGFDLLLDPATSKEKIASRVKQQLFLTTIVGDSVVVINGIVTETDKTKDVLSKMKATASTLKESSEPIDLKQIQRSLR